MSTKSARSSVFLPSTQAAVSRRALRLGFRQRLLLSLLLAVFLTAVLVGGLGYLRFQNTLEQESLSRLNSYASTIAAGLILEGDQVRPNPGVLAALPEWGTTRFRVQRDTRVYFEGGGRYPDNLSGWLTLSRELGAGFMLEVALSNQSSKQALVTLLRTELLAIPLSLGIALVIAYFLFSYLIRPIHKLTEATHALAQQRFPEPLEVPPGKDELTDLAQSFNRMTQEVRDFLERERSFTRYTSHELRTPLATLRVQIEALEQSLLPPEESIAAIKRSLTRLERILAGLLALTRSPQSEPSPVALGIVLDGIVSTLPKEQRWRVKLGGDLQTSVLGYEELVRQALDNLISNALKFSQGTVEVSIQSHQAVSVQVRDRGPGVPESTLARLGEPFMRLHPKVEGLGLGLALVRHIAGQLKGKLEFANQPTGGLLATLSLPKAGVKHVA